MTIQTRTPAVRQAAIGALSAIGHPETAARIAELLESADPLACESAVRIAGYFGYPQTRERVFALAADADALQTTSPARRAAPARVAPAAPHSL